MAMLYFLVNFASGVAPFLKQGLAVDIFFTINDQVFALGINSNVI